MLLDVAGAMMAEGDQESLISMTNFVFFCNNNIQPTGGAKGLTNSKRKEGGVDLCHYK
jgi:hypothetical protein